MDTNQTRRRGIFKFIDVFLEKGSIHGLAYVGKKLLTVFERLLWCILTFVMLLISIQLTFESVKKYKTKSTMITVERDYVNWNITLPSITICPMTRLSLKRFESYCDIHEIAEEDRPDLFSFLESLANSTYFNFEDITEPPHIQNYSIDPMDYMYLIYNLTDDLIETTGIKAEVAGHSIPSRQVLTEWGICYTTNNFLINDISTKNLLFGSRPEAHPMEKYMVVKNAFKLESIYHICTNIEAIAQFIHDPNEVMQIQRHKRVSTNACYIEVKMLEILASDEFGKENTIEQRKCRFPNESNLKNFPIYTNSLCVQQCRADLAYKLCKCIPHFYPNLYAKTPVCHYKVLKECLSKYKDIYGNTNKMRQLFRQHSIRCECLPNCRLTSLEIKLQFYESAFKANCAFVISNSVTRKRYRRQTILTLTDLLVSIGGTVSFFLGFNVLSAVEIVYYFTIRLFWYSFNYRE